MNKRQKGLEFQRYIANFLRERGWTVHNQLPGSRYQKNRDIFGADLIARQADNVFGVTRLHWIQATLDSNIKRKVDEFKKFFKGTMEGEQLQIWVKRRTGEITIKLVTIVWGKATVRDIVKITKEGEVNYIDSMPKRKGKSDKEVVYE